MKCPLTNKPCNKVKEICITEDINGEKTNFLLCEDCASSFLSSNKTSFEIKEKFKENFKKVKDEKLKLDVEQKNQNNILSFFEYLFKGQKAETIENIKSNTPACPECGTTIDDLINSKKLGCMGCYDYFGKQVDKALLKLQHSIKHVGKVPKNYINRKKEQFSKTMTLNQKIENIENNIKEAVKKEDYESAAMFKVELDKIKLTKKELIELKAELKKAIEEKDFEKAEVLRKKAKEILNQYLKQ